MASPERTRRTISITGSAADTSAREPAFASIRLWREHERRRKGLVSAETGRWNGVAPRSAAALAAEATSPSVSTALTQADEAFRAMTAAARAGGVDEYDIRSTGLSIHPSHDHRGRADVYSARMPFSLALRDLATAGGVLAAVVEAGGDNARVQGAALGMENHGRRCGRRARGVDQSGGQRAAAIKAISFEPGTSVLATTVRVRFALD